MEASKPDSGRPAAVRRRYLSCQSVRASGLSAQVGDALTSVAALPVYLMMLLLALAVTFLTEATSNTATTAPLLPVLAAVALAVELDPLWLMVPAAMSASCAFAAGGDSSNAVVFARELPIQRMVREGFVLTDRGCGDRYGRLGKLA